MTLAQAALEWYDANRRNLPWRRETDPYAIWVSEIMLQQTRAETVEKRYAAFLRLFPDVSKLAAASEDAVLKAWEGLGYYARARNLRRAAKIVSGEMGGRLPETAAALRRLPGMGAYAACSVASIAFGEPVPALDANLARIFARVTGRREPLASPADLYPVALASIDPSRPGDFNQALMDIGATLCLPRAPRCLACPLYTMCAGGQSGAPEDFPEKLPKPPRREERRTVLLALSGGGLLLRRRPVRGLLGGLWEFPALPDWPDAEDAPRLLEGAGFRGPQILRALPEASHAFTHLTWRMRGLLLRCEACPPDCVPVDLSGLDAAAMPSALRPYREEARRLLAEAAEGR